MLFVVLCPRTPEGSTGSGSGIKASLKMGQRLKVSSERLGEAGNRTCDPWFTKHRFIPFTTAAHIYWVLACALSYFLCKCLIVAPKMTISYFQHFLATVIVIIGKSQANIRLLHL